MEGFEVVTSDDHKIGHVLEVRDRHLVVEHGLLKKTQHAVPDAFAHTSDDEQIVRLSVSKEIVESSPKLEDGSIDTQAVAEHFGLAESSADQDLLRAGDEPADEDGTATDYFSDQVPGRS
jgi:hypothetical protein